MIRSTLIILLLALSLSGLSQQVPVKIDAGNQALNAVLIQLRDQYGFQFSYSESEVSKYKVNLKGSFTTKDAAVDALLKNLPLQWKKRGDVFIIIPVKKQDKPIETAALTSISGRIVEAGTYEPLPFSHILINNQQLVSDVMGGFHYLASADSSFRVRISHLGYQLYDTLLLASANQQFILSPSSKTLNEITVQNNPIEKATLIGDQGGKMKINYTISRFLPGQGDNSVFNLLRLMPGIQAAGEQSTDLLIWGSYEGQSQITFDEFTVFGLKNFNDNISVVNPFMVKNIEIYKGGYEARYGNRVGGLVNISGKNGNMLKPSFHFNINPTTLNGMAEIPLFKKSSLILAYRQTYYNLYNTDDFNIYAPTRPVSGKNMVTNSKRPIQFDLDVYPDDYRFRDLNLKYTIQGRRGDQFTLSAYRGGDHFELAADASFQREIRSKNFGSRKIPIELTILNTETNQQNGLSLFYGKNWNNKLVTQFIVTHSGFSKQTSDLIQSESTDSQLTSKLERSNLLNSAIDNNLRIENSLPGKNGVQTDFGGGFYQNVASIQHNNSFMDATSLDSVINFSHHRAFLYFQQGRPIGDKLKVKAGARVNYLTNTKQLMIEPRIQATFPVSDNLKLNAAWGIYRQFMYKMTSVDRENNYTSLWVTANNRFQVLSAMHWVGGMNYFKNNLSINLEAYYKTTGNLTQRVLESRWVKGEIVNNYELYRGDAKTWGIDTYVKKEYRGHSIWTSYSLSQALERFAPAGIKATTYTAAPHDQRHEFKIAALLNFGNFYLSGNYVYGSGMEILRKVFADETNKVSYHRFDAAFTWRFGKEKLQGETGLSVLNVFDTQNLKYANIKNIRISQELGTVRVYTDAVPFTPILFLKMSF
ncbi:MAG: TonB-dependent receptor plug domain-containing protein [Prolixibacteraceae bacterium]|nr:TonB-dependent receptor plug domain-containing protein [Prolixibacteraceae bacterium]